MAERERRTTPPFGGVFVPHKRVMDADDVARATVRIAHEVIERNHGLDSVVVIGLQTGGVPLAARLVDAIARIEHRSGAGRHARRRVLPRRHRHPSCAAGSGHRHRVRGRRRHGGAGRRRAVHRTHHPGRPQRVERLRAAPVGAAGRHDRPRSSRAADPPRLRRQEPADSARRDGRRQRGRRAPRGRCANEASPVDRRPRPRRHRGAAASHRLVRRGERAVDPEGARAARHAPSCRSSTRTRPAPGSRSRPRPSGSRPTRCRSASDRRR